MINKFAIKRLMETLTLLIAILVPTVALGNISMIYRAKAISLSYTSYPEIDINNEVELATFPAKTGSGGSGDPYVIKNLAITVDPYATGIYIRNTFSHLTIQNCMIIGNPNQPVGIFLGNCSNVKIDDCTIHTFYYGIKINQTSKIEIQNNDMSNISSNGLNIQYSTSLTIKGNTISETAVYGIFLWYCSASNFIENTVSSYGLAAINISKGSTDNYFISNELLSSGDGFFQDDSAIFNKFLGNKINGVESPIFLDFIIQQPSCFFLSICLLASIPFSIVFRKKRGTSRLITFKYCLFIYLLAGFISFGIFVLTPNITVYNSTPGYGLSDIMNFFHPGMAVDAGITVAIIIISASFLIIMKLMKRNPRAKIKKQKGII
ncbi:MAG: right-handed parallel beta-helix repeat-containing protein [Candidatus Hodarchaeota archaeon]